MDTGNDTGSIFRTVKEQLGWYSGGPPQSLLIGGKKISSPKEMASEILKFNCQKIKTLVAQLPVDRDNPFKYLDLALRKWNPANPPVFKLKQTNRESVLSIIKGLGKSTAFGRDYIDAQSVKVAATILANPILYIVNLSLQSGVFPRRWKVTKVVPLHKGKRADKQDPASYRCISLVATISKIAEKTVQTQVIKHMDDHKLFNHNHHAYRPAHSTTTTLLQLSDALMTATDASLITTLVTIDESAAFDCVNTEILLGKMVRYGFDSEAIGWFRQYLNGRQQYIAIGDKCSPVCNVERGVPQGSVLGPLLYTLYINELPEVAKIEECTDAIHNNRDELFPENCSQCPQTPCYADDATLVVSSSTRQENQRKIDNAMDKVTKFLNCNELTMNKGKTNILECMVWQKRARLLDPPPKLEILEQNGRTKIIKTQDHIRLLGANYSQNMTWNHHMETGDKAILPDIRKTLGGLKFISKQIPATSRLKLANSLILSKLLYVMPLWGSLSNKYLRKTQATLNRVARWVLNADKSVKTGDLMDRCRWQTVKEMIEMTSTVALWKILRDKNPRQISEKLTINEEGKLITVRPRLQICRNGFTWKTVKMWNKLPTETKEIEELHLFKKRLKEIIRNRRTINEENTWPPPGPMQRPPGPEPPAPVPTQGSDAPPRAAPALGSAGTNPPPGSQYITTPGATEDSPGSQNIAPPGPTDESPGSQNTTLTDDTPTPVPTQGSDAPPRAAPALGSGTPPGSEILKTTTGPQCIIPQRLQRTIRPPPGPRLTPPGPLRHTSPGSQSIASPGSQSIASPGSQSIASPGSLNMVPGHTGKTTTGPKKKPPGSLKIKLPGPTPTQNSTVPTQGSAAPPRAAPALGSAMPGLITTPTPPGTGQIPPGPPEYQCIIPTRLQRIRRSPPGPKTPGHQRTITHAPGPLRITTPGTLNNASPGPISSTPPGPLRLASPGHMNTTPPGSQKNTPPGPTLRTPGSQSSAPPGPLNTPPPGSQRNAPPGPGSQRNTPPGPTLRTPGSQSSAPPGSLNTPPGSQRKVPPGPGTWRPPGHRQQPPGPTTPPRRPPRPQLTGPLQGPMRRTPGPRTTQPPTRPRMTGYRLLPGMTWRRGNLSDL